MLQVACGGSLTTGTYRIRCSPYFPDRLVCTTSLINDLKYRSYNFFSHRNGDLVHGERSYTKFDISGTLTPIGSVPVVSSQSTEFSNGYGEFLPEFGGKCLLVNSEYKQLRYSFDQVITSFVFGNWRSDIHALAQLVLPVRSSSGECFAIVVANRSKLVPRDTSRDIHELCKELADLVRYTPEEADAIASISGSTSNRYHMTVSKNTFKPPKNDPFVNLDWVGLLDQFEPNFTNYDKETLLGEMSQDIADDIRPYQTNIYASLMELPTSNPFNTLTQVVRTAGVAPVKAASDIALESQYGFNLTVKDAQAFANALLRARDLTRVYRSSRSISYQSMWGTKTSTFHAKAKVRRESSDVIDLIDNFYSIGVMPTLEGAWDLIPFSFVVDWFIPISDWLKQLDAGPKLCSIPLEYILLSEDKELNLDDEAVSHLTRCHGQVTVHRYKRWIQFDLPPVRPHFDGLQEPHPNWVAAAALLVRRKS